MARTRRQLLIDSGRLAAGGAAGLASLEAAPLAQAAPDAPPLDFMLPDPPFGQADYYAFADWVQPYFDQVWRESRRVYDDGMGVGATLNASLLTVHSIAALRGHDGACRADARARQIARRLCESPPWKPLPGAGAAARQPHRPGWTPGLTGGRQHTSVDPKIAESLTYAWLARRELDLPADTVRLIVNRVNSCARGHFFRFPQIRLNQINWPNEMYAHAATVTGNGRLLRSDYRRQLVRFARGIKPHGGRGAGNLSPSYSFHYQPDDPARIPHNLDSAEYANIVLDSLSYYDQARRSGMRAISAGKKRLLAAWVRRALCGYWTHAGYLNWDTGLSLRRWHLGRYWAFSLQGLLAIVTAENFRDASEGRWAKYMFDRSLKLYQRLSRDRGGSWRVPRSSIFDVHSAGPGFPRIMAARFAAAAMQATDLGLHRMAAAEPPPLYSFDPSIGRLAVTTPVYNTAILGVNNGAVPYGGIELARLFDSDQRVLAGIGGRPPASFGVVVRDASGSTVLKSQHGRTGGARHSPVALTRSPRGGVHRGRRYPRHPYAGSFQRLEATGHVARHDVKVKTTNLFLADHIQTRWTVSRHRGRRRLATEVLFPSWGRTAQIEAVLTDGRRVVLAAPDRPFAEVPLDQVDHFHLLGLEAGYVVLPVKRPAGGTARIKRTGYQPGVPHPGPSLSLQIGTGPGWKRLALTVRIAPGTTPQEEAAAVARLKAA